MKNSWFHANHPPVGAAASFTLGFPGAMGGLDLELGCPAKESFWIGHGTAADGWDVLPFCGESGKDAERFAVEGSSGAGQLRSLPREQVTRTFSATCDRWESGPLRLDIWGPHMHAPDPESAPLEELRAAYLPMVPVELQLDNRHCAHSRTLFFGWRGSDPRCQMRLLERAGVRGMAMGGHAAVVTGESDAWVSADFEPNLALQAQPQKRAWGLGTCAVIAVEVPAGVLRTIQLQICFYRQGRALAECGIQQANLDACYAYTQWFADLEAVAVAAVAAAEQIRNLCQETQTWLEGRTADLSADRRTMLWHGLRGYYANTALFTTQEGYLWVVLEGEYRMFNTMDLLVDQIFWEEERHPWVTRNVLDWFWKQYRYCDEARLPDGTLTPGGVALCHDMGVAGALSAKGKSSYERPEMKGCFSYMSYEELLNWVLCALLCSRSHPAWGNSQEERLLECMHSMVGRDSTTNPTGLMQADGAICEGGSEITTYDSLDASLGQARGNLYLAVKTWAAWSGLHAYFRKVGHASSGLAKHRMRLAEASILAARGRGMSDARLFPALLDGSVPAVILPAIEGLLFARHFQSDEELQVSPLVKALGEHLSVAEGICRFSDGGWKLSSTADNSWLSKIFLCQSVAEGVFGMPVDSKADASHLSWLLDEGNAYWAFSDQMMAGKACGSRYYPRGSAAWSWLPVRSPGPTAL